MSVLKSVLVPGLVFAISVPLLAQGGPRGNANQNQPSPQPACCLPAADQPATTEETKWLVFMREEEKLAHDVYQQLAQKWNLRVFANIAKSESRHFEAVGTLLERYGISDPAAGKPVGAFSDPELAALYQQLMAKGNMSIKDALEVGVLIEKHDIGDLEDAIKAVVKTDIKTVFTNLLAGSLSHLEAFEHVLEVAAAN